MSERLEVEVCIIGAGPVGGTLACRLAAAGIATALVDRAALPPMEDPAFDGRAYAIAAGSQPIIEAAGLWRRLPWRPGPITGIRVSDGKLGRRASPLFLHFDANELGSREDGPAPFGWMVEARSLRVALNRQLRAAAGLHLFAPAEARVRRADDGASISIAGGPEIAARLVVAADGRRSALRQQAGIAATPLPYGQSAIVCCIAHDVPHRGVALEHFLPAGPFAQLPMAASEAAENISAIVWTEPHRLAGRIMRLDEGHFIAELGRRMGPHLGRLRLLGGRWSYPLSALLVSRYTAPRLVLVGDAAHGIHPIAGQGLNLGYRDITTLAQLLIAARAAGEDLGGPALLRRYQRARRPDNFAMLAATDALDRLFSNDLPPLRLARGLGIAAVHRIGPLKRMFMRRAMGVA